MFATWLVLGVRSAWTWSVPTWTCSRPMWSQNLGDSAWLPSSLGMIVAHYGKFIGTPWNVCMVWDGIFLKWHSATLIFQIFDATWLCFSWFNMKNEAASQAINAAERRRSRTAMCRCQGRSWGSCPWHVELQANLFGHMTLRNVVGVVALWHPSMCFVRCGTNVSWFALNLNQSLQQKVVVDWL